MTDTMTSQNIDISSLAILYAVDMGAGRGEGKPGIGSVDLWNIIKIEERRKYTNH
jgi:hypothetical protein